MNIRWYSEDGRQHAINHVDKVVIYGHGVKLFERETDIPAYTIKTKNGEQRLFEAFHGGPVAVTLHGDVKNARKENLNRKDNYVITYHPEYWKTETRYAIYIHESEIDVTDLGDIVSMETEEEKNYLHAVKLHFNGKTVFNRYNVEHIQVDGNWKIPDGGRWGSGYGTEERPTYDTYDYTNSISEKKRKNCKGVIKRWITTETIENAEIITAERYYTKTDYSDERKRKNAIAEKLNASKEYNNDKWSHYDITKLERALGYKLSI